MVSNPNNDIDRENSRVMKRMNRKRIIEELESLRGMCATSMLNCRVDGNLYLEKAYLAHHNSADRLIVELGGESTKAQMDTIIKKWDETDLKKIQEL